MELWGRGAELRGEAPLCSGKPRWAEQSRGAEVCWGTWVPQPGIRLCWLLPPGAELPRLFLRLVWGPGAGSRGRAWAQCPRPASPSSVLSRMFRMSASSSVSSSGCWATYGCTHWTWGQSEGGGGGGRASSPRPCAAPHPANPAHRLTRRCLPSPAAAEKGSFFGGGGGTWLQKKGD